VDAAITTGPIMTTIGVGAVFVALGLLIAVVVITSHLIDRRENGDGTGDKGARSAGKHTSANKDAHTAGTHTDHTQLLHIALAAYGLHRRNGVAVRGPQPLSQWATASRVAQRERFPGKT